jgi:hypothetical protein
VLRFFPVPAQRPDGKVRWLCGLQPERLLACPTGHPAHPRDHPAIFSDPAHGWLSFSAPDDPSIFDFSQKGQV